MNMPSVNFEQKVAEKSVVHGKWWFGNNRRRQYAGILHFGDPILLEITGKIELNFTQFIIPRIHGISTSNEYYILDECYIVSSSRSMVYGKSQNSVFELEPRNVLGYSNKYDVPKNLELVDTVTVTLPWFEEWLGYELISHDHSKNEIKYVEYRQEAFEFEQFGLDISSQLSGVLSLNAHRYSEARIKQLPTLSVRFKEKLNYKEAIDKYRSVEAFYRFAYAQQFFHRSFTNTSHVNKQVYGKRHKAWPTLQDVYINMIADKPILKPEYTHDYFLFTFGTMGGDFQRIFQKWLNSEKKLAPIYQLLFSTFESGMYLEQNFLNLTMAVELFHKRFRNRTRMNEEDWELQRASVLEKYSGRERKLLKRWLSHANEVTLEERITDIVREACNTGFRGMSPETITKISQTRNYFVHEEYGDVADGFDLGESNRALTELLIISILQEIGFDRESIRRIASNRRIFTYSCM